MILCVIAKRPQTKSGHQSTKSPAAAPAVVHRAPLPVAAPPTAPPIQTVPTSARSAQRAARSYLTAVVAEEADRARPWGH